MTYMGNRRLQDSGDNRVARTTLRHKTTVHTQDASNILTTLCSLLPRAFFGLQQTLGLSRKGPVVVVIDVKQGLQQPRYFVRGEEISRGAICQ